MASSPKESFAETWVWSNARRLIILVIILSGETVGLRLLRRFNPRMQLVKKLFVMYPANEHYARKIVFGFWMKRYRKRLAPCMVFRQGGTLGLVLGTTICEKELRQDAGLVADVKCLADEAKASLGISDVSYSGLLPTLLIKAGLITAYPEADTTAEVVAAGVEQVRQEHSMASEVPVVILGGAGQIGARVATRLREAGRDVHVLDPKVGEAKIQDEWRDRPLLLVNVAHRGALRTHLPLLWDGVVYVNEVYPEPRPSELSDLAEREIPAWHVAGVRARALPPFPGAYGGGIPCCAASIDGALVPVMRRLA